MAEALDTRKKVETANDQDKEVEKKPAAKIEAYLTGPRKRRKNYVIFALGETFDKDLGFLMDSYVRKNHSHLSISHPKTPNDLKRQFNRNIALLVLSDQFAEETLTMTLVRALKQKRRNDLIPVLFLTKNATHLIDLYHKELLLYHEADEYAEYTSSERPQIIAKLKYGIETKNQRRSRRYSVRLPMNLFHLNRDQLIRGEIIDLSIHGAVVIGEKDFLFSLGDQIKLTIPIAKYVQHDQGDFLRVSGKVRRVFISGNKIAVSFEHVTDLQTRLLSMLLIKIVDTQFQRQTAKLKIQMDSAANDLFPK